MLLEKEILRKQNIQFDQSDSGKLADIINHDIIKLRVMEIAIVTHNYDCLFIEEVLNKVEALSDIDRFIGIIKTHWEIDVLNRRDCVTKYDITTKDYVPYVPDFKTKIDSMRDKIAHKRELELQLKKQWEEWEVEHQSPSTKTEAPHFQLSSPDVQYETYPKIADLDINVQSILYITNDEDLAELVDISRNEIWPWLLNKNTKRPNTKPRPKKDANVIRFAFRYYKIVDPNCSVKNFVLLFNQMVPEAQLVDDTVSSREDANMKSKDFYKYQSLPDYNPLKKDTEQLRKMLQPIIKKLE